MRRALAATVLFLALVAGTAQADHSVTELVTPGTAADVGFAGAAADGSPALVFTSEPLAAADQDSAPDIYAPSGGSYKLLSDGAQAGPDGSNTAVFRGASADGSRLLFSTSEALVPDDGDFSVDVYEHSGSTTTLLSDRAQPGPDEGKSVAYGRASADGSRVFFTTDEALVAADNDSSVDVYERPGGTTTLISVRPASAVV